ncbi:tubulin epsilon and delta complex protein 1 isoform X2 [Xenopus laevis]|uniref:Tubulin epsilon and delta complex protein 1 domain-containing protein n=2 Tax=Xenopus laevis TaxID=8355 RepID=A0A974H8L4_XENLA|nr:tubulin epsilon and delta complex protein 1 isoform X2 [Xenopus laevis]OCT68809.1 hypothetical protein XELAEV_18040100mg [Xenopus laevis]
MKRGGSSQLREVLCALCRLVSGCGVGLNPETFRRAKFDRPETAPEFWNLLYCLLTKIYQVRYGSPVSINEPENLENRTSYVKTVLWHQGYGRSAFYHLPFDGSQGSRELLLAFSWLLLRMRPLERILQMNRVSVGDEISFCMCPGKEDLKENKDSESLDGREVDVRYLQWLNGKLSFCWRSLHAAHQEKCTLQHKIHSYTQGCHVDQSVSHLSVLETDLVRHPENYTKLLQLLQSENTNLEAYMEWKRLEPVYWQWMVSVLESTPENDQGLSMQDYKRNTTSLWSNNLNHDIDKLNSDLDQKARYLQELLERRRSSWNGQIKEIEKNVTEKELRLMFKKIKQEVQKNTEDLKSQRAQAKDLHGPYRLVFREASGTQSKNLYMRAFHATELVKELQKVCTKMEAELQKLQDECRCKLEEISEEFEGIICIPPAKG